MLTVDDIRLEWTGRVSSSLLNVFFFLFLELVLALAPCWSKCFWKLTGVIKVNHIRAWSCCFERLGVGLLPSRNFTKKRLPLTKPAIILWPSSPYFFAKRSDIPQLQNPIRCFCLDLFGGRAVRGWSVSENRSQRGCSMLIGLVLCEGSSLCCA